ncbi:MAG: flagellar basal body P-ring formation chaperone FlgA [Pseudomonadota bacterium]
MTMIAVKPMADFRRLFIWVLAVTPIATALATELQSLDSVRAAAEQVIATQVQTSDRSVRIFTQAGALDSRLRLAQCSSKLQGFLPGGATIAARTTVGVRCAAPAWSVYVPVTVESELSILVLKAAVSRGAQLRPEDVESSRRRVPGFPAAYISDVAALAGRHLKNAAGPGAALTADLLVQDILVKRGQRVTLVAVAGGIEVRANGEAVADATSTGRVKVQNLSSQKVVEGQVETADRVRISL